MDKVEVRLVIRSSFQLFFKRLLQTINYRYYSCILEFSTISNLQLQLNINRYIHNIFIQLTINTKISALKFWFLIIQYLKFSILSILNTLLSLHIFISRNSYATLNIVPWKTAINHLLFGYEKLTFQLKDEQMIPSTLTQTISNKRNVESNRSNRSSLVFQGDHNSIPNRDASAYFYPKFKCKCKRQNVLATQENPRRIISLSLKRIYQLNGRELVARTLCLFSFFHFFLFYFPSV